MSQEDFALVSPVSSEADTPKLIEQDSSSTPPHDPIDVQILSAPLTKDRLIHIALSRMAELRAEKKALLRDKENALRQVDELRMLIQGMQQRSGAETVRPARQPSAPVSPPLHSTPPNNEPSTRKQLTKPALPEKFNGIDKSPTISNWLFSVRLYLKVTRTEEEDYVMMATTLFTAIAIDWWQGIVRAEGESVYNWNWKEFEARCIRRFQAVNDAQVAYQKLLRWKQSGTITGYLAGFQSMIQQIPFELLSESGRVFMLIEGLHPELQKSVRLVQPTTLDEAISIAQRVSVFNPSPNPFSRSPSRPLYRQPSTILRSNSQFHRAATGNRFAPLVVENIETTSSFPNDFTHETDEGENSTNELECSYMNTEQKKLFKERKCFKCKRVGHHRHQCPTNSPQTKDSARM